MKKSIIILVAIAFLCMALLPASVSAATSSKVEKKAETQTTTQNGGSLSLGRVYYNGTLMWSASWSSQILINASILAYLQTQYPSGPYSDLLNQIEQSNPGLTNELTTVSAIGDSYTQAELQAMAAQIAVGQRGGVYSGTSSTVTIGTNVSTSTSTTSVGNRIVQTDTTTVENIDYNFYQVSATRWVSPIILDMKGSGVLEASNGQYLPHHSFTWNNAIVSDFNSNGFEVAMEWVGPNDGLLVAPKKDGSVDATCLFGTTGGFDNGFQKLSLYDRNNDGVISGDELSGLFVWQDGNQNATVDNDEMQSLSEAGITSLSMNARNFESSFVRNGKTCKMWDWWPTAMELVKVASK